MSDRSGVKLGKAPTSEFFFFCRPQLLQHFRTPYQQHLTFPPPAPNVQKYTTPASIFAFTSPDQDDKQSPHGPPKMHLTRFLLEQSRQPMIRFLGKRVPPTKIDHTPRPHPAAPSSDLPSSFASYRQKAQQHGPLNPGLSPVSSSRAASVSSSGSGSRYGGHIGSSSGRQLGSVEAGSGEVFDVSELPARFRRRVIDVVEIEAVESGGGSLFA